MGRGHTRMETRQVELQTGRHAQIAVQWFAGRRPVRVWTDRLGVSPRVLLCDVAGGWVRWLWRRTAR
jgi:hypothetical protein